MVWPVLARRYLVLIGVPSPERTWDQRLGNSTEGTWDQNWGTPLKWPGTRGCEWTWDKGLGRHPPPNKQPYTCENSTCRRTTYAGGNNHLCGGINQAIFLEDCFGLANRHLTFQEACTIVLEWNYVRVKHKMKNWKILLRFGTSSASDTLSSY